MGRIFNDILGESIEKNFKDDDSRFNYALKNSSIVVAFFDKELRYRWIYNPHPDFDSRHVLGKRDDDINKGEGMRKLVALKQRVIENEESESEIITFDLSDGKKVYNFNVEPFYNNKGKLEGGTTAALDITEHEMMKNRMINSEKFSALGKLASGVAHEFNNILAVIMGNVQLILKKYEKEDLCINSDDCKKLELIVSKCKRAKEITNSLMKIADPKNAEKKKYDLTEVLEEVINLYRKEFIQNNIEIVRHYRLEKEVKIDVDQIKYVIMNLISNSIHAIIPKNKGEIIIYTYKDKKNVIIIFSDTGIGMGEETVKKIFNPFFTTKGGYSKNLNVDGTGLGLSVSYKYIENHNGSMEVKSVKGKGTTMLIKLPL